MKTNLLSIIFLSAMLSLASCGGNTDTKDVAEDQNDEKFDDNKDMKKDADKVVEAYSSSLMEEQLSRDIAPMLATAEAKSLAEMMTAAHQKTNDEIRQLAQKKAISLPQGLTEEQAKDIEDIKKNNKGIEVDKKYVSKMVDNHKDQIDKYKNNADNVEDPDAKAWFASKISELEQHHQMAENAWDNIKDRKN